MLIDFHQTNELIKNIIVKGQPASILRIDNTAGYIIECILKNEYPNNSFFNENTLLEAGIFPTSLDYAYKRIYPLTIKLMISSDILGFVDVANSVSTNPLFNQLFLDKPVFSNSSVLVLDPGALLNHSDQYECTDPWTKYLKDKRVLVISTHAESIKQQWNNIDKIWGSKRELIAPFELVDVIRSPYHPNMDDRMYPNCNNWEDSVEYIKDLMSNYNYDILLTGSTTSSPFYAQHAKDMGKIGIQTGGSIQLFFGVLGYRWTHNPSWFHNKMFNEHWIYPLEEDEAKNRNKVLHLESNYAYWSKN